LRVIKKSARPGAFRKRNDYLSSAMEEYQRNLDQTKAELEDAEKKREQKNKNKLSKKEYRLKYGLLPQ
jgi:uncharacterized FlaG/YvyC family protein